MNYDVVILGGGIAGLSLSIDLKDRGYAVAVIEKGNYPRHKVCGEYLSMESRNYLQKLYPTLSQLDLPLIKNFRLTSTAKKEFRTTLDLGGFGISRYLLEELLYREAEKKGVVFLLNSKALDINYETFNAIYSVKTNSQNVNAFLVCDSTGRKSHLETVEKNKTDIGTNYVGIKYHVKLSRDPSLIEIHNFPGGYCGISNIEGDKSCLCYIVNSKKLNRVGNSIAELENSVLFKNKHLEKIFNTAEFLFKEPVTISGINFRIKKSVTEKSFYLGDSAGSVAPITGNGMSVGLRSASVLAILIDQCLSGKITKRELTVHYKNFWYREFSTRIKWSRYFQKLSEYPLLAKITIGSFNSFPGLAKAMIKQTHGKPF